MRQRQLRRRGFFIMEMFGVLIMLGVFSLVSARLFTSMFRQVRDRNESQATAAMTRQALARLRGDVWRAETLQGGGRTLVLSSSGRTVTWAGGEGGVSRTELVGGGTPDVARWPGLPATLSFAVEAKSVSVEVAGTGKAARVDTVTMLAEAACVKGGGR